MPLVIIIIIVIAFIIIGSLRQINEYERGVRFRFGRFDKIMNPGLNLVLPIIHSFKKVDIRTKAVDVPAQDAITADNVSISPAFHLAFYPIPEALFSDDQHHLQNGCCDSRRSAC